MRRLRIGLVLGLVCGLAPSLGQLELPNQADHASQSADSFQHNFAPRPAVQKAQSREASEQENTSTYAQAFAASLENLPILESQRGETESGGWAYREDLLHKPGYRYPSLIRRTYASDSRFKLPEAAVEIQVADQFLLQIKSGTAAKFQRERLPETLREQVLETRALSPETLLVRFRMQNLAARESVREQLTALPEAKGVFNDRFGFISANLPKDPYLQNIWSFSNDGVNRAASAAPYTSDADAQVAEAWDLAQDCSKIPVAVLDTGVDYEHPDLKANILMKEGRSFVPTAADFRDDHFHGTHVAGTIAAVGNNEVGISGVCWKAQIIPIKVMDAQGAGTVSEIVSGFNYAVRSSAKIANASLAFGPLPAQTLPADEPLLVAIREFAKQGKLLVTAAGNDGIDIDGVLMLPIQADSDAIIGVAATGPTGALAPFSNFGSTVDIAAPGAEILSTVPTASTAFPQARLLRSNGAIVSGYGYLDGTSMATPLVAGITALFWSQVPELPAAEVKRLLIEKAKVSGLDLKFPGDKLIQAGTMLDGTRFSFEVTSTEPDADLQAGAEMSVGIRMIESGFFKPVQIDVMQAERNLASSAAVNEALSFRVPREPDISLIVRVKDNAGRSFDSRPLLRGVAGSGFDFSQLVLPRSGLVSCSIFEKLEGERQLIYQANVDSQKSCQKLCDIVMPLMGDRHQNMDCGGDL